MTPDTPSRFPRPGPAAEAARFLAEAGAVLASSLDYETTLASVARLAVPRLADWCLIHVKEEDGSLRRLALAQADPTREAWVRALSERYPLDPEAPTGVPHVVRTGQSELVPEITDALLERAARDADHLRILRELGLRSGMVVPLAARGRTLGAITLVAAESGHRYGPEDLAVAEDLGRRAGMALDNARLYREAQAALRQREEAVARHRLMEERLTLLVEASGRLASSLEPAAVLAAVLDLSHRLIDADAYAIWRQAASGAWNLVASSGLSAAYLRSAGRIAEGANPMADRPIVAEDAQGSAFLESRREAYRAEGIASLLAVPLRIHGRLCGTLVFYYRTPHPFDELTVRVATAQANLAAAAIGTAELYTRESRLRAQAEEARHRLAFLADASAALASSLDYQTTLAAVARLALPRLADWCAVDIAAGDGTLRRLAVAHRDPARVAAAEELYRRYPPDPDAPGGTRYVFRTGRPELMAELTDEMLVRAARDEEHLRLMRALGLRSYVCVPLRAAGKTLGVLTFAMAESGRRYGEADLTLAEDLAHRAAIAIENSRLYHEVREAVRRKDEFLAMLAHELRNPLAPITNALHILKQPGVHGSQAGQVRDMMERQVLHLVRLVDDLLDVSRIMRGKIELRQEAFDLATAVARAVEAAQPGIDAQAHRLEVCLPPGPLPVRGDPVRLAQVFANLLNNACRYTDRGGRITLAAGREGDEVVVRVRDTGIGIAADLLPHIFELFVQGGHPAGRAQGGLGIGLTLARRLVEMHGGSLRASSPGPGRGSEFEVRLPAVPAPAAGGHANGPAAGLPSGAPRRVLVVDDNVDAAESLALVLRLQGHAVRVAHSGPAALDAARAEPPQVVFLDIGMPGMDGYEVARRLREQPDLAPVVLVAVTGWGQEEDRQRARAAGFDHHLTKPADPDALQRLLGLPAAGEG